MKFFTSFLFCILITSVSIKPQNASATWPLTSATTTAVTVSGDVAGQPESFGGMTINNYTGPNSSQRVTTSDGNWPAESQQNENRYIQFAVSPAPGYNFTVGNISMNLGAAGGSNMRANIWYSTDAAFNNPVQLNSSVLVLPNGSFIAPAPDYSINETVNDGGTFYLRIYPWYTTSSSGKYVCPQDVVISGTSLSSSAIFTSVNSLVLQPTVANNFSPSISYFVNGTNLSESVVVKAPDYFKVSTDNSAFSDSLVLSLSGGSLPSTEIYVRFEPLIPSGTVSGILTHTSGDVSSNFLVSGIALIGEPTISSNVSFGLVTGNSITVNFSGGNGSDRLVVVKSGSAVNWQPSDGIIVSGINSNYQSAADQGSGNKVVYSGMGSQVTVTGLAGSTDYYFAVYEFNVGTNNSHNYLTSSSGTGSQTTAAAPTILVSPTSVSFGNVTVNTISLEKNYSVSANTLTPLSGVITITAPAGFEISTTSGSGFSSFLELPYTGGTLNNTTIYVRFLPTSVSSYGGNISNAGADAVTKNVAVTGNGIAPGDPNVFEAEDGLLFGSFVRSQYTGYSGSGYVDLADRDGSNLEFIFRRDTAATNLITVYYANGGSSRSLSVRLNDVVISSLSFTGTGSWTNWSSVTISVPLVAGINRLKFASTTNGSNPNIDRIMVAGSDAFPMYKLSLLKSGSGTVSASPLETYYDAGAQITVSAFPSVGNTFFRWGGTENNFTNPAVLTMNSHKTVVGIMMDTTGLTAFPLQMSPEGFASMNALGNPEGTTGGSGSEANYVFITSATDFVDLMYSRVDADHTGNLPPLTVYIVGTLFRDSGVSEMIDIKDAYDISVIGVGNDASFSGVGLKISRSSNIIVRNIFFVNAPDDGISIQADDTESTGHHIWIDHCSFTNNYDAAIDVTHTASYVTVSWNHIYNNNRASLMGHSDSQTSDSAMKVTYHHNFFDQTIQRHPRIRFGKAHVYNNYYLSATNTIYGVSSNLGAQAMVEGNYFVNNPIPTETSRDGSPPGYVVERDNIFINCGTPGTGGTVFEPSGYYPYSLDPAANVPALLTSYSGSGVYDFSLRDSIPSPVIPAAPVSLDAQVVNSSEVILSFTPNGLNENVILVWNNTGIFTTPSGLPPSIGGSLAGGTLLYNGTTSPQMHIGLIPATTYFYKAFSFNGSNYSSGLSDSATTAASSTFQLSVSVQNGWNMVSVPGLHPVNQNVNTWWSGRNPLADVYKWTNTYEAVTNTEPSEGYWMLHTGDQTYNTGDEWPAGGIQFVSHDPIAVTQGWNMIGGYENSAPVSGLTTTPPGLIVTNTVYGWNGTYFSPTNLEPGFGYWVLLSGPGVINPPTFSANAKEQSQDDKNNWGRIIITDANGRSITLFSVNGEADLEHYQMPPLPPAGSFDVRFSSNRKAENLKEGNQTILLSALEYPVTIKVENASIKLQDETGKLLNTRINKDESFTIHNRAVTKLLVGEDIIPDQYILGQNYPNPFNPATTIEFSIPENTLNVTLIIYDALGQKVSVLVNQSLGPGFYKYKWDADDYASGLYVYELKTESATGGFRSTKKMLFLK
ncbi:MAG: carbohydrate-binding protein [Ignavibacteriales bacterium]|nr:MAG: carbohydrate-binding protein [Ignavibacteriales bacterium]